jgi:hypothetical protein
MAFSLVVEMLNLRLRKLAAAAIAPGGTTLKCRVLK